MDKTSTEIRKQLGLSDEAKWEDALTWGLLKPETKIEKGQIIFPRLEIDKELVKLNDANQKLIDKRSNKGKREEKVEEKTQVNAEEKQNEAIEEFITIDDFAKVQLRLGKVTNCENHPKADKLLVLTVKIGEETRTIVSGIRKWYNAEDLIGKKVVVAYNLKPVKLRGIESRGMILAAEDSSGNLSLLTTLAELEDGAIIS